MLKAPRWSTADLRDGELKDVLVEDRHRADLDDRPATVDQATGDHQVDFVKRGLFVADAILDRSKVVCQTFEILCYLTAV